MTGPALLDVGERRLEISRWPGRGVPILLLHEGLGSVSMWRDFPARLSTATGREVIAWSRDGHGRSVETIAQFDPDYMYLEATALSPLMDALGISRAHLFGHSDGGSIALLAAAVAPERVASLMLEAPHVFVEDLTIDSIDQVRRDYAELDLAAKLARHHDAPERVFWRWNHIWLDQRFRSWNIEPRLGAIAVPTLLVQGHDDQYGTLAQLDRIAATIAGTQRLELTNCGHSPHRDRPDDVLRTIADFLEQQP